MNRHFQGTGNFLPLEPPDPHEFGEIYHCKECEVEIGYDDDGFCDRHSTHEVFCRECGTNIGTYPGRKTTDEELGYMCEICKSITEEI